MNYILLSMYYLSHLRRASSPTDRIHCTSILACLLWSSLLSSLIYFLLILYPISRRTLTICLCSSLWCLISPCQTVEWFLRLGFEACLIRTPLFLCLQVSIILCFLSTRRNLWFQGIFFLLLFNLIPSCLFWNPNPLILPLLICIFKLSFSPGSFFSFYKCSQVP